MSSIFDFVTTVRFLFMIFKGNLTMLVGQNIIMITTSGLVKLKLIMESIIMITTSDLINLTAESIT